MTDREIQTALLAHYRENWMIASAMSRLDALRLLLVQKMGRGVCFCAKSVLKVDISNKRWIEKYVGKNGYWGPTPADVMEDMEMITAAVEHRIHVLEKILRESA